MIYCELTDINDTLLKKSMVQSDIDEGTAYVDAVVLGFGVTLKFPAPYEIKQIAISYACMRRALYLSGKPVQSDVDAYELKRKAYAKDVQEWESKLTVELLTGAKQQQKSYFNMTMKRC